MSRRAWGDWLRGLLVGAMAVGYGAAGLLLSNAAVQRPLLPCWGRVLIGTVALGALLTSLLALQAALEVWGLRARNRPDVPVEASRHSLLDTHRQKPPLEEPPGERLQCCLQHSQCCGCARPPLVWETPHGVPSGTPELPGKPRSAP